MREYIVGLIVLLLLLAIYYYYPTSSIDDSAIVTAITTIQVPKRGPWGYMRNAHYLPTTHPAKGSTSTIKYIGNVDKVGNCASACEKDNQCSGMTWFTGDDPIYKEQCYLLYGKLSPPRTKNPNSYAGFWK